MILITDIVFSFRISVHIYVSLFLYPYRIFLNCFDLLVSFQHADLQIDLCFFLGL